MKYLLLCVLVSVALCVNANKSDTSKPRIHYVNTSFENASPANWEIGPGDSLTVSLVYDYERSSPNRSNSHWHYQVEAEKGMDIIVTMQNFNNIWNGMRADPISERSMCYVSANGKDWKAIETEVLDGLRLRFKLHMTADKMYLASVEPYDVSDVENLLREISNNPLVDITSIGKTVEGRNLEIVKIGDEKVPNRILIRVRAHGFEAGGNWTAQGLIRSILDGSKESTEFLKRYCLYIMPMANKDAVARGKSRFNSRGVDLNRNWQKPPDSLTAPENYALEEWLKKMIAAGKKPDLLLDLHNDGGGNLHIARPDVDLSNYLRKMKKFEDLLRKHTWFTEGSTSPQFKNPGAISGGLLERYGIDGAVYELNYEWIEGLKKHPFGKDWEDLGNKLRKVFYEYFGNNG